MSKAANGIWTTAEQAVGLPACPPDMSSPQLASFIYDYLCMVCSIQAVYHRETDVLAGMPRKARDIQLRSL